jgi:Tol biopolymer transport system component
MRLFPPALTLLAVTMLLPGASTASPPTPSGDQRPPGLMVLATSAYDCPTTALTDDVSLCTLTTGGVFRQIGHGVPGWEPTWSPGKRSIAFADGPHEGIWRIEADATKRRRLTLSQGTDEYPAWSPDGRQIAFDRVLERRDHATDVAIWLVDADGRSPAHRLTHGLWPDWSPDGRRIAFLRLTARGASRLQVIDADGRHRRLLRGGSDPTAGGPHWSPDGRFIGYVSTPESGLREVRLLDLKNGRTRTLVRAESIGNLDWSPDGNWLAYVIETDEEEIDGVCLLCHSDLWLHRVADGRRELIFSEVANVYGLDW